MRNRKLILPAFLVVVVAQLFVPGKMIWDKEKIWLIGTEYKFRTAPVDPSDPFRGKYITLSYANDEIEVDDPEEWSSFDEVYVIFKADNEGFARIEAVSKSVPGNTRDYLKTKVRRIREHDSKLVVIYPFSRFYMEESKAKAAERAFRSASRDSNQTTYALVAIRDGDAVLKEVYIDDVPIEDAAANWVEK
jgi:uncharacterized membrane-anchored protein